MAQQARQDPWFSQEDFCLHFDCLIHNLTKSLDREQVSLFSRYLLISLDLCNHRSQTILQDTINQITKESGLTLRDLSKHLPAPIPVLLPHKRLDSLVDLLLELDLVTRDGDRRGDAVDILGELVASALGGFLIYA